MNQYFSEKIKVVSFFSIILVLYIHSGFHDYPHEIQECNSISCCKILYRGK